MIVEGGDPSSAVEEASGLFANASAVQNDRVIAVDGSAFQSVGVTIIDVIEEIASELF